jgi:hypothetical protein
MTETSLCEDLFQRLARIEEEAFAGLLFDTSYHLLAGMLHCARSIESIQPVLDVSRLARERIAFIDQNHPGYEHSTASAAKRHHESIFKILARQADSIAEIHRMKFRRKAQ